MAAIVKTIEIARRPDDVFSYATDFSHFPEWQGSVVSARPEGNAPPAEGSRAEVTRRVGPRQLLTTEEITELHPPRTWTVRGVGGSARAIFTGLIEPQGGGKWSRVTLTLEFEAHGIGKVLVPLVIRRQGRRQLPKNAQQLKEVLERDGLT